MVELDKVADAPVAVSHASDKSDPLTKLLAWLRRHQMSIAPIVFIAPALIMFSVYVIYPIVNSIWISFHDWDGIVEPYFIGLGNYEELILWDESFLTAIKNNVIWLVVFMLAPVFGLFIALFLNQTIFGIRLVVTGRNRKAPPG